MKALSIKQPWAAWIMVGAKDIENRTWRTLETGKLVIHASRTIDPVKALELPLPMRTALFKTLDTIAAEDWWVAAERGSLIGVVDFVGCVRSYPSPWFEGPWGWVLSNPVLFREPIDWKGRQGLSQVPDELVRAALGSDSAIYRSGVQG